MTRAEAIEILRGLKPTNTVSITDAYNTGKALTMAIASLETDEAYQLEYEKVECKAEDCISREELIEFMISAWEEMSGDDAMQMCIDKARSMPSVYPKSEAEDCISRADAIRVASGYCHPSNVAKELAKLPSVTPQEPKTGHCKDCKWWKDKDGVYRRGISAESKCPINRREVMEGMGYCFMFEPQESEG